ncbi:MAG: epoxyqueuosine reductase [Candidatus Thorarchaeota archaeon]|nr:epoxyqueuosine reductase [Candidatus Thorarchaeota archaeon]
MGIKHKLMKAFIQRFGVSRVKGLIAKQRSLNEIPGILHPTPNSTTRFEIPLEMMNLLQERDDIEMRHMFPIRRLLSVIKNIHLSVDSISNNPLNPSTNASTDFLEELKEFAQSHGVGVIEFVKLPQDLIFHEFGALYDNAIILAMEMSKEKIDKAASQETMNMVFGTYDDLGKAANRIAEFLREHGYAAQADHPLGGLVLFPPLAQKAGIGWVGKHGLLITPKYGPRVRLAAVYTGIENLPFADSNDHGWIDEYCKICGLCIKQCPPQAILKGNVTHDTGRITNIKQQDCFEYFAQFYGCSICVKACPFSKAGDTYERLKAVTEKKR